MRTTRQRLLSQVVQAPLDAPRNPVGTRDGCAAATTTPPNVPRLSPSQAHSTRHNHPNPTLAIHRHPTTHLTATTNHHPQSHRPRTRDFLPPPMATTGPFTGHLTAFTAHRVRTHSRAPLQAHARHAIFDMPQDLTTTPRMCVISSSLSRAFKLRQRLPSTVLARLLRISATTCSTLLFNSALLGTAAIAQSFYDICCRMPHFEASCAVTSLTCATMSAVWPIQRTPVNAGSRPSKHKVRGALPRRAAGAPIRGFCSLPTMPSDKKRS